jgi:hypothetical protein
MSIRHLLTTALLGILVGLAALPWSTSQLPAQQAAPAAAQKRCVGISTSVLRSQNPVITRLYRVFDDGSVETYDDGASGAKWTALGK